MQTHEEGGDRTFRGPDFFMSTFFLAPKKGGKWRPILNLKPLNKFIVPQTFKMGGCMGNIHRSDGCLPSYPSTPGTQKVSDVPVPGPVFSLQGSALRTIHSPSGFYPGYKGAGGLSQKTGGANFHVSGRLVSHCSRSRHGTKSHKPSATCSAKPRLGDKRRKVRTVTDSNAGFSGRQTRFHDRPYPPHEGQGRGRPGRSKNLACKSPIHSPCVAGFLGYLASLVDIVSMCRFRMRDLQLHLLRFFDPLSRDLSIQIPCLYSVAPAHLRWWRVRYHLERGRSYFSASTTLHDFNVRCVVYVRAGETVSSTWTN